MLTYKNRYLKYALTYYDEINQNTPPPTHTHENIDVILERQYSKKKMYSKPFHTLIIDITAEEKTIFSSFEKNTKYEINRAMGRDNITIDTFDVKNNRSYFYDFYNQFALTKKLGTLGIKEIDRLIDNDMFIIRHASCNGEIIIFHSYIISNKRARLAHSVSHFRMSDDNTFHNLVGRANRLLHWEDMLYFKALNYHTYDLGGISTDKSNSVRKFKECFNGRQVTEYNSMVPVSWKGFLYVLYRKLFRKSPYYDRW